MKKDVTYVRALTPATVLRARTNGDKAMCSARSPCTTEHMNLARRSCGLYAGDKGYHTQTANRGIGQGAAWSRLRIALVESILMIHENRRKRSRRRNAHRHH